MPKKSKRRRRKKDRSARKIQQATRDRLSRKNTAATKIQSRLRGNMTRRKEDVPWTEPLLSVPYRDTDWKSTKGLEMPWEVEKSILKSIIYPEGLDDIKEGIDELEKKHDKTTQELERLRAVNQVWSPEESTLTKNRYDIGKRIQDLKKQLQGAMQLDLFQCRAISKMVKADGRLSLDPEIKELIKPCRELDINVYINTVYTLPKGLFHPIVENPHSIYSKIESFPDEIFTNYGKSMLRKTLEDLELMYEGIRHDNSDDKELDEYYRQSGVEDPSRIITGPAPNRRMSVHRMTRFELLANFYRYSDFNRGVDLKHLDTHYYAHPNGRKQYPHLRKGRADGRSSLEETLELFEANIRSREMVESFTIDDPYVPPGWPLSRKIRKQIPFPEEYVVGPLVREDYLDLQIKRMKIHFIFALIGMDDIHSYYNHVRQKIEYFKKMLPVNVEGMPLWKKHDTLDDLTMEDADDYVEYENKIKEYQFIFDNLL
tara:strand:+ start:799 stop:2256 length:1458 start_codon:yes stop_codon:yes gene_type:complete